MLDQCLLCRVTAESDEDGTLSFHSALSQVAAEQSNNAGIMYPTAEEGDFVKKSFKDTFT